MLVMQYYGLKSLGSICTMQMAIKKKLFNEAYVWITLTGQILEALRYMHDEAHIIHNDLKSDNVLVTDSFESTSSIQILIVDFGKATERDSGRKHKLSETQKEDYKQNGGINFMITASITTT